MIRWNLENVPLHSLPEGYAFRWYEPGYEEHWLDIHLLADDYSGITPDTFSQQFNSHASLLPQRQCYLLDPSQRFIGTATAWFKDDPRTDLGRLHWVAIIPEFQGQGLATPFLTTVLTRMRELGHARAYLTTQTISIRAVNLYAAFGFVPLIRTPEDRCIWADLQCKLKVPFDLDNLPQVSSHEQ